jgi:DNA polymerase I
MAMLNDPSMATAIREGKDLHTESAVAALHLNREPTDEERQIGKVLNFSIVYGGGRPTIMKQLGVTFRHASLLLDNFHRRWPGIQLLNRVINDTLDQRGFIKTLWGRHLHPESQHKALRHLGDKLCASHLVLTIHDELVLDALEAELPILVRDVPDLMNHAPVHEVVPVDVDCEISRETWADKEPIKEANV